MTMTDFEKEAQDITQLLQGKAVRAVKRFRAKEVLIEFTDGTRFFIDGVPNGFDFSITAREQSDDLGA
jgi:hypothetical protein